jgi:hypothetical protein
MTIKTFTAVLAIAFVWTACNNDTPQQSAAPTEAAPAASPETSTEAVAPQDAALPPGAITTAPPAPVTAPATQATAPAGGAAKPNPPHGQPGHVCGTPVGTTLDGAAASMPSQQPAAKSVTMPPPSGGTGAATGAPGTNPPHGQPGHVCGTPVGQPLPKQ